MGIKYEGTLPKSFNAKENRTHFELLIEGDSSAREKLFEHNMRLVFSIVNGINDPVNEDENFSNGMYGLLKAVDTFDPKKEVRFSTYAIPVILNEIRMGMRSQKKYSAVQSYEELLFGSEDDDAPKLEDTLEDKNIDIERDILVRENITKVRQVVVALKPLDTKILVMYFGLFGNDEMTQNEMAEKMEISRSYVSRLLQGALKRFRALYEKYDNGELSLSSRGKKPQSFFSLFPGHSKLTILKAIKTLSEEDLVLIELRYGKDLRHPRTSVLWNEYTRKKFYGPLLYKLKCKIDMIESGIGEDEKIEYVDSREEKRRDKFNKLHGALLSKDFNKANVLLREYLEENEILEYETLMVNLIILSIRAGDFSFNSVMHTLHMIPDSFVFDMDKYKEFFYSSLTSDPEEAKLYLEIINSMNRIQETEENTEDMSKALKLAMKKK